MLQLRRLIRALLLLFLLLPLVSVAQVVDVRVQVTGAEDVEAPSVPTDLVATAVSASQINLSWTASTDNIGVSGYRVFRGNVQVATSSAISYADTGLTAETTYEYYIVAFDQALNISNPSATATAQTLALPPEPAATTTEPVAGGSSGSYVLDIKNVLITPWQQGANHFAQIKFESTKPALSKVYYGLSADWEQGVVSSVSFTSEHYFLLSNLEPGRQYFLRLELRDQNGVVKNWHYTFATADAPDVIAPSPVANFRATIEGEQIILQWQNPRERDLAYVELLRSPYFYPLDRESGLPLYKGGAERFVDADNLVVGKTYFYTIFACDYHRNCSAASLAVAYPATTAPPQKEPVVGVEVLERNFTVREGEYLDISIEASQINYSPLAIMLELVNPQGEKMVYPMRYEEGTDTYLLSRFLASNPGEHTYIIYSYKTAELFEIVGRGRITVTPRVVGATVGFKFWWWWLLLLILVLITIDFLRKHRHRHNWTGLEPRT